MAQILESQPPTQTELPVTAVVWPSSGCVGIWRVNKWVEDDLSFFQMEEKVIFF